MPGELSPSPRLGWLDRARDELARSVLGPKLAEVGEVVSVGDGVAMARGLPNVRLNELVRFARGQTGFVQQLGETQIGCILLDEVEGVEAGDQLRGTGEVVRTPVGPALLGRVVDPLGRPLDGGPEIVAERHDPLERAAPAVIDRDLVTQPVQTGVLVVDAMFALGRGQRELIIGDRAVGKTALAVDAIINQRGGDMVCVYVAIGQKSSSVARVIDQVRAHGAAERCIFVVASPAAAPGLQWLAPFAGMTMAEYFRDSGQHALIVLDDLTKHAATHRELALLVGQPPGREAYPGDVFYLHARLLERAAKLSKERGGGSLTALPVVETEAGNLSAYIPTNLISITDGQIVLDAHLFNEAQKPAVDVGASVSRVGGKTQAPALRATCGSLRLEYAQFLELELFTRFGEQPDPRVRAQIDRGRRVRGLLAQPQYAPLRVADQAALALAVSEGVFDALADKDIPRLRAAVPAALDRAAGATVRRIQETGALGAEDRVALLAVVRGLVDRVSGAAAPT
jgi:F-type H+-transporting ATPase subunit alpha